MTPPLLLELDTGSAVLSGGEGADRFTTALPVAPVISIGLFDQDPPAPQDLSNALGVIDDALGDLLRQIPGLVDTSSLVMSGRLARMVAQVEIGSFDVPASLVLGREALEEVFRTLATEGRADRAFNPGLDRDAVDDIVVAMCVIVALVRRLRLDSVRLEHEAA